MYDKKKKLRNWSLCRVNMTYLNGDPISFLKKALLMEWLLVYISLDQPLIPNYRAKVFFLIASSLYNAWCNFADLTYSWNTLLRGCFTLWYGSYTLLTVKQSKYLSPVISSWWSFYWINQPMILIYHFFLSPIAFVIHVTAYNFLLLWRILSNFLSPFFLQNIKLSFLVLTVSG